jgi:hypothetical protein
MHKKEEFFFRFRQAMTNFPEYKAAIDLACGENDQTIEQALEIARCLQRSKTDEPNMKGSIFNKPKVGFEAAAAYSDKGDRIKILEVGMEKLTMAFENFALNKGSGTSSRHSVESRMKGHRTRGETEKEAMTGTREMVEKDSGMMGEVELDRIVGTVTGGVAGTCMIRTDETGVDRTAESKEQVDIVEMKGVNRRMMAI